MIEKLIKVIQESLTKNNIIFEEKITIEIPSKKENGDYSTNVALKLAKTLKRSPMEIAELISNDLKDSSISKMEVKQPGFINFFVTKSYLFENLNQILNLKDEYGKSDIGHNEKINVEFVSANPTGILHLGNARGGAYGDNVSRILKFTNFDVNKEYYVNDSGNQVDNLGKSLKVRYQEVCGIEAVMPEDGYFGEDIKVIANDLYKEYESSLLDKEVSFFKEYAIKKLLDRIMSDLKEYRIEYDTITSEKAIKEKGYIDHYLDYYKEKDFTYEKENAVWFKGSLFDGGRDFVLIKSDGAYTYVVPDIAHHEDTIKKGYKKLINVLGADHHGYVPMITSTLSALGYNNILDIKLLQLVRLIKDGQECRMSKRSGKAVTLKELIDEVGVNATRYFFASRSLDTQMDFNIDVALKQSNENPIYYISYAYARICTILKEHNGEYNILDYNKLNNKEALDVLEKLYNFPDIVRDAALKEMPHIIANYCYDLANLFHIYYSKHRIISDDEKETAQNINFIKAVQITLKNSLWLIGIIPPERM